MAYIWKLLMCMACFRSMHNIDLLFCYLIFRMQIKHRIKVLIHLQSIRLHSWGEGVCLKLNTKILAQRKIRHHLNNPVQIPFFFN